MTQFLLDVSTYRSKEPAQKPMAARVTLVGDSLKGSARGQERLTTTRAADLEQQTLGGSAVFVVEHLIARQFRHDDTLAETWPSRLRVGGAASGNYPGSA